MSDDIDNNKLPTSSYKGVRDFPPEDQFIQRYIFDVWRNTARSFGYEEYSSSILETAELYQAKTGREIVDEQTYTFKDRGDRDVTLRPEMTPTLARMIAARKRELKFPVRWFSIPNVFRYERPQRGRLREHWQLNADIFGVDTVLADVELVLLASSVVEGFGIEKEQFGVYINDRRLLDYIVNDLLSITDEEKSYALSKLLDKKEKTEPGDFKEELEKCIGERAQKLLEVLESKDVESFKTQLPEGLRDNQYIQRLEKIFSILRENGADNIEFNPALVRGFDYYTGFVFEGFDKSPKNNRAIFGGGRYNELLSIFGEENVPAAGVGVGDVTMRDMLEEHDLLPDYRTPTDLYICTLNEESSVYAQKFARRLREEGLNVVVDVSEKKVSSQIQTADKHGVPFILCIGGEEIKKRLYILKELKSGEETQLEESSIVSFIIDKRDKKLT